MAHRLNTHVNTSELHVAFRWSIDAPAGGASQMSPHATSIATPLESLLHDADVTAIQGESYRVREGEPETAARRKK